jgi:hypothetical protein
MNQEEDSKTVIQAKQEENSPLLLQPIPQLKHFYLHLSFPLMLDDALIRLALPVFEIFDCSRVGSGVVAWFEVRGVALHVA